MSKTREDDAPEAIAVDDIAQAVAALRDEGPTLLLLGGATLFGEPLEIAGRIAARHAAERRERAIRRDLRTLDRRSLRDIGLV